MTVPAGEQHAREKWERTRTEARQNAMQFPYVDDIIRDADAVLLALSARVEQLETLVRQAAPFVNAVAVMADDKSPSLGWLADASALASVSAGKPA